MRLWILSDAHFGKHSVDSEKWLAMMNSYFYDFFIPLLKSKMKPGDKMLFLGDLFDNRNSINLKIINEVIKLFETLGSIIECHVLLGNHDMYLMNSSDINSPAVIKHIPNVNIYDSPKVVDFDGLRALMMPWIHGKDNEKAILEKYSGCDLLFCHSDLNGCRTQLYPTRPINRNILDIDDFSGYGKVYSGHIHIVQTINNFTFVGSPYHLDRNDVGNTKGVFVYDTKKRMDVFLENDHSPEYKKIIVKKEKDLEKLEKMVLTNNYVDLEISKNLLMNAPHINIAIDRIKNKNRIERIEYIDDIIEEQKETKREIVERTKNKSIKDVAFDWVDRLKFNDDNDLFSELELKDVMKETIDKCYTLRQIK